MQQAIPAGEHVDDPHHPTGERRRKELLATRLKLAELLEARDDLAGALKIWQTLLAGNPKNISYLSHSQRLATELERFAVARGLGRRLVKLAPGDLLARTRLAQALSRTGLHAEALVHLEWVAGRGSRAPAVRRQLARALEATGHHARALKQLVWLGSSGQANLEDHLARVRMHRALKQPYNERRMLRWLLPRIRGKAAEAEVRRELAENLEAANDLPGALKQYHWLVARTPDQLKLRLARMRIYTALKQPQRAQAELTALRRLSRSGPGALDRREVREGLAAVNELLRRPDVALTHYNWLAARFSASVEYQLGRAGALGDLRRYRQQLRVLAAAALLAPEDPRVQRELAEVHFHQQRYPLAERHYRTVLVKLPRDPLSTRRLAWMQRHRKRLRQQRLARRKAKDRLEDWIGDAEERAEDF